MFSFVSRLLQPENCFIANLMNSDAFYNSEYFKAFKERLQSRSQGFAKGGGGLFWKFDTTANELDLNFH